MVSPAAALRVLGRPTPLAQLPSSALDAALVAGRVILAMICVADIWWRGSAGEARTVLTDGLVLYGLVSATLAARMWHAREQESVLRTVLGVLDACAIGLLTLVDDPFGAHLFLVLSYAFVATGYPGSVRGAVGTTGLVAATLIARMGRHLLVAGSTWLAGTYALPLAAASVVFAWSHATRHAASARASAAARMIGSIRPELGPTEVFRAVLDELLRLSTARAAVVVLRQRATGRTILVRFPGRTGMRQVRFEGLPRSRRADYFFECSVAPSSVHSSRKGGASVRVLAVGTRPLSMPPGFLSMHPCRALDAFEFTAAEEWDGRLFLLDPADLDIRRARQRWMHGLLQELVPAVVGTCDLSALRARAAARERARIGRELHDGIVQELARLDIELELLRRAAHRDMVIDGIQRVQERLQTELAELRAISRHARSQDVTSTRLTTVLAETIARFNAEAGIDARFVCDVKDVNLSPQVCGEITRIVQEALVNVRRHSGAKHVLVRFGCDRGEWRLSVQDDGRGFQTWVPLGRGAPEVRPPAVIEERAHAIGARLRLGAGAGCGARLDIALGQES